MPQSPPWRRRQHSLAEFATRALVSADLEPLLEDACRLVGDGLESPVVKVLKWMPDSAELLLCAQIGIPPEIARAGATRVPDGRKSAAGYSVLTRAPVISDLATESRFEPSAIVRETGIRHSLNVLVTCDEDIYGVLEADRTHDEPYTETDIDFLQTFASLIGAAVLRLRASGRISRLLQEKELLLRELQHRVKNDLQVIVSIIELQLRRAQNPEAREQLQSISGRIDSLRLVHDHLYRGGGLDRLDLAEYMATLAHDRFRMHGQDAAGPIRLKLELDALAVARDVALPLGLIANEFITNSFKHAFPDGHGTIRVSVTRSGSKGALVLADDGAGHAPPDAGQKGTGLRLIELLARQIRARPAWSRAGGTRLELVFDLLDPPAGAKEI